MARIFLTDAPKFYRAEPGGTSLTEVTLPTGVTMRSPFVRPDLQLFQGMNRVVIVGQFSPNLVSIVDTGDLWILGITAPTGAPTLAAGAGTGITGSAIGKYTFAEIRSDGTVIHESKGSPASGTVVLANQKRAWSGLPTTHANARVTHKRLYVSMDGDDYLFVANVPLADATYTENVATNLLGDALNERRGVPPVDAIMVALYGRRAWYSNGSDSFWYSEIDEPESVASTAELKTRDGRNITTMKGLTDQLVILTRTSLQDLQGFGLDDFQQRMISQDHGSISHHGSIVIGGKLWFPDQDGYKRFAGSGVEYLMPKLRSYFRAAYEADPDAYEDMVATVDRRRNLLIALVPGDEALARAPFYYLGHTLPADQSLGGAGELPYWTFMTRGAGRYDRTVGVLTEGNRYDRPFTGSCDGYVRLEGVGTDDDGLDYELEITPKHFFMGDQGGDDDHAHTFERLDAFVRSETTAWTIEAMAGDDGVVDVVTAPWSKVVAASGLTKLGRQAVPKTSHSFIDVNCAGKGLTVRISAVSPVQFKYRGLQIYFRNEGKQTRLAL